MPRGSTHVSKVLRFALCDPQGRPVFVSSTVRRALGEYVSMQKGGIVLDDESEARYWELMKRRSWSIRNATMTCNTTTTIEELLNEEGKEIRQGSKGRKQAQGRSRKIKGKTAGGAT